VGRALPSIPSLKWGQVRFHVVIARRLSTFQLTPALKKSNLTPFLVMKWGQVRFHAVRLSTFQLTPAHQKI
jgi:hypothetical protein